LIRELREAKSTEYCFIILAFINCFIASCEDVEERTKIRSDLSGYYMVAYYCKLIAELT